MTWNYRFIKDEDGLLNCHEVYYDENGNRTHYTTEPINPFILCSDEDEVFDNIKRMQRAIERPVLTKEDFDNE